MNGDSMRISLPFLLAVIAAAQQSPPEPVFQTGTRLVEVDVVVRHKPVRPPGFRAGFKYIFDTGPPFGPAGPLATGLTRDDFTVLDDGKPQPIAVFGTGPSGGAGSFSPPPGAVSNRTDNRGQPLNGSTAVLVDLLNTPFENTDYARVGLKELLRSLGQTDTRIALYSLGERLHILHDFADDPQELMDVAAALDQPHGRLPPEFAHALRDFGDIMALEGGEQVAAEFHGGITVGALRRIIQHLSGMPGRKNLVWLMSSPWAVPPAVMAMVERANIVLYPVLVRSNGFEVQEAARTLARVTGATAFFDARDLAFALQAADEDFGSAWVLGYYPTEDMLDGKYHRIAVKLRGENLEVHYRTGYFATRVPLPAAVPAMPDLFDSPLASSGIGLAAQATSETEHPDLYDVRVTIDLHDIRLERRDGHSTGAFDFSVPDPSAKGKAKTGTVAVDLTDEQLVDKMQNGYSLLATGVESDRGEIRMVVRDRATGAAGSLRIPVSKP